MPQPTLPPGSAPTFYLTARQPLRPGPILLAIVASAAALSAVLVALGQAGRVHLRPASEDAARSSGGPSGAPNSADDKDDDPNQIDTIVLGDPADAPVPGRHDNHVSPVHPTIIVRLPRFGPDTGLIPDSPTGHLLYNWLAAFNHASYPALQNALPTAAPALVASAEIALRRQTGGFSLLSAREVAPGLLVFRLRDQTPAAGEVLGSLQMRQNSSPPAIATFSLRAVPPPTPSPAAPPPP